MSKLTKKERHQVKSRWYYLFWGAATVSVFAGQMYVGSGYRKMSNSLDILVKTYINRPRTAPAEKPLYQMPIIK